MLSRPLTFSINAFIRDVHIFSAMFVLLIMVFFSVSGFFLTHPNLSYSEQAIKEYNIQAPAWLKEARKWNALYTQHGLKLMLWLDTKYNIRGVDYEFEWDEFDNLLVISLQSPGNNTLIEYFIEEQIITIQKRPFSLLDTLNNVHRAKHTTTLWKYMSDASAIIMLLFCLTGFWLAVQLKGTRQSSLLLFTLGSGVFVLALYLMH